MASDQAPIVKHPADGAFDFPASHIPPQFSTILHRRLLTASAMRTYQIDATRFHPLANPIRISCLVVQKSFRKLLANAKFDERFQRVDFREVGGERENRQRQTLPIRHQHDLRAFTFLGLAYLGAPFFAGENVPSPIASDQCSNFRRSIFRSNRRQASSQIPASVHSRCRRQHVVGLGYRSGKSCHRAPLLRIHKTPSRHSRGVTLGRPPFAEIGGCGNRFLMSFHWELVINWFGAVLDPVVFGRRLRGHIDREINMRGSPFTRTNMQLPCQSITFLKF